MVDRAPKAKASKQAGKKAVAKSKKKLAAKKAGPTKKVAKKAAAGAVETVSRRIQAYFVHGQKLADGANTLADIPSLVPAFAAISTLSASYDDNPNRYVGLSDGNELFMVLGDGAGPAAGNEPVFGQFAVKRRSRLPLIETAGTYRGLALATAEGLAEIRHFGYWPQHHLLLIEFNFFAPRISRFNEYLYRAASGHVDLLRIEPVVLEDGFEKLDDMSRYSEVRISVLRSELGVIQELDASLFRGLRALRQASPNAREVTLAFELGTKKKSESLSVPWLDDAKDFFSGNAQASEAVTKLILRGHDEKAGRTRDVDLLEGRFDAFRGVALLDNATSAIDPDSMFAALNSAYNEEFLPRYLQ